MEDSGKLICTICPQGCQLTWQKAGGELEIAGNRCPRGHGFALAELTNPLRTLTTTVRVTGGEYPLVPVRSTKPIPKAQLAAAMRELAAISLKAPLEAGAMVLPNWRGTGVDFVTTRPMPAK